MTTVVPFKDNTCPLCGEKNIANGMGPSGQWYTSMIKLLPSSKLLKGAANIHDCLYHLGKTEKDRKRADEIFLNTMKKIIKKSVSRWRRPLYYSHAYRNYLAVRWFGKDAFNYGGCLKKKGK